MNKRSYDRIRVAVLVNKAVSDVWNLWTVPEHILKWNHASEDWRTKKAENNLTVGGTFNYRMEAKDGSVGFDFCGTYTEIKEHSTIYYTLDDGRSVRVTFTEGEEGTTITEIFEPETDNTFEVQQVGWQLILDNFKKYAESPDLKKQ